MPDLEAEFRRLLAPVLRSVEIRLSNQQLAQLTQHYVRLRHWNQKINVTSVREPAAIVQRHFGESLFLACCIEESSGTLVDVGSGPGFPGLPFGVAKPGFRVTLVESVGKKAAFLKEVARSVANVSVFHGRLTDVSGRFEWASVRGVNPSAVLPTLRKLAANVVFLTSLGEAKGIPELPGFVWKVPLVSPWGDRAVVIRGRPVPRETSEGMA